MINFTWILFFLLIGLLLEKLVKLKFLDHLFSIDARTSPRLSQQGRIQASLINILPDTIGLCIFIGVSYLSFILFDPTKSPVVQLVFMASLICLSLIRVAALLSSFLLSPQKSAFRIFPLKSDSCITLHRLSIAAFAYLITALMLSVVIQKLGAQLQTVLLLQLIFATLLLSATALLVLLFKSRVATYMKQHDDDSQETYWLQNQIASTWHILALVYLILIWSLLVQDIADPDTRHRGAFLMSFFVVPIWITADKVIQWLVKFFMDALKIHQTHDPKEDEVDEDTQLARENGLRVYLTTKKIARLGLLGAFGIWIASLWNIEIPFLSNLAAVAIDTLIIMTLALIFWKFVSSWIEQKIEATAPDDEEETDNEWGGSVKRGRSYTLLPMVRKFLASVLVVMVTMTILSSIGVDIGPLLAGAGVVGLAVGFGAQKLVADMFSGFFYLLDDAFRVGEYLTAGSVSGTVENITLRNVMLRHHRGMLQIVPHSELGPITNFMRGGIVVKFNLDFPYDANIDKIRKIIKKVGIAMLNDEELGKDFIRPVKSQGVREITNSVMTIRVKFTAQPGTHFVIRREAYKRITESLQNAGIHYAHRKVIVDVPSLERSGDEASLENGQTKNITEIAGAAALSSIEGEDKQPSNLAKQHNGPG